MYDFISLKCPEQAILQTEIDQWLPRAGRRGEWGVTANGCRVSFGDD